MFMDWLFQKLQLKKLDDWYNINDFDIIENGGKDILQRYGSSFNLLLAMYPNHQWKYRENNKKKIFV